MCSLIQPIHRHQHLTLCLTYLKIGYSFVERLFFNEAECCLHGDISTVTTVYNMSKAKHTTMDKRTLDFGNLRREYLKRYDR